MAGKTQFPLEAVRACFPSIVSNKDYIFSENAGGSQVLGSVADTMRDYLLNTNVQMGECARALLVGLKPCATELTRLNAVLALQATTHWRSSAPTVSRRASRLLRSFSAPRARTR